MKGRGVEAPGDPADSKWTRVGKDVPQSPKK